MPTIYRGASFILGVVVKDSNGDPYDLTGATARAEVRRRAAPTAELVLDLEPTITLAPGGVISINVSAAATAGLEPQTAKWDLIVDTAGGDSLVIVPPEDIVIAPLATAPA